MNTPDSLERDREAIMKTTTELLAAVNASKAEDCVAVWAPDGVLMPPNHPSVQGHQAIGAYFRSLFLQRQFRFAFTSSHIHVAGDTALERVTYTVVIRSGAAPRRSKTWAKACMCTSVRQTARGSSPATSGTAIDRVRYNKDRYERFVPCDRTWRCVDYRLRPHRPEA